MGEGVVIYVEVKPQDLTKKLANPLWYSHREAGLCPIAPSKLIAMFVSSGSLPSARTSTLGEAVPLWRDDRKGATRRVSPLRVCLLFRILEVVDSLHDPAVFLQTLKEENLVAVDLHLVHRAMELVAELD